MNGATSSAIKKWWSFLLNGVALTTIICAVALLGFEWGPPLHMYTPVHPVAGAALAALFLDGLGRAPWVFMGIALARLLARPELSIGITVVLALVHTLGYVVGAVYLRSRGLNRWLATLIDVRRLIVAAALVAAISASSVFLLFYLLPLFGTDYLDPLPDITGVFFGRFTGIMIVGSLILTFSPSRFKEQFARGSWKGWVSLIGVAVLTSIVFSSLYVARPVTWLLFPPLVVAALTGNTFLAAQSLLIVGAGGVWGTTHDLGPFANVEHNYVVLQGFLSVVSLTSLVLTAVAQERREKVAVQQRGQDLQFLSDTTADLLSSTTLIASVERMAMRLAERCNVEIVTYHGSTNGSGGKHELLVQHGIPSGALGSGVLAEVEATICRTLEAEFSEVTLEQMASDRPHTSGGKSVQACVCQPIVDQGKLLGILCVASCKRTTIEPSEAKLLETVGYDIATAARRLRQEDQLRESESRFRQLSNAVPDIVFGAKADGTPDFYNQRWYEFTGETESPVTLVSFVARCESSQRDDVAHRWEACLRSGDSFEMEHQLKHHSGTYRWVLTRALPIRAPNGAIVRWVGTSTDLHEKRILEAQRDSLLQSERSARMEAEQANRLKDEFLANLSHELRNPLNVIVGWTHLLSRGTVEPVKAAQIIERSAHLQAQLIEDLLDLSRIVSGKLTIHRSVVYLSDVVSSTLDSMQLVAREKGVELVAHVAPHVELAQADVGRMTQIVSNLLTNAIKFTPKGGRVTVTLAVERDDAVLTVSDTGEGISAEFLPHIFDRFRQADPSTTRRHGGLGIGLAIVQHMTALHGGSITASSPGLGQGASFTVHLPLRERSLDLPMGPSEPREATPGHASEVLHGAKIVVVEDDPPTLEFLERVLSEKGARVFPCSNGRRGLEEVRSDRPDLVITDIGMPDMDGYQLAKHLREIPCEGGHLPIVAVTAFARPEDEAKALQAGFDAHITKPVDIDRLERTVLWALGRGEKAA